MNIIEFFVFNQAQEIKKPVQDLLTQILAFIYSIAHYIGLAVVKLIQFILPMLKELEILADPIGYLAILTIFLVLVSIARKIAWIIVIVGWILIIIRIILMILGVG